MLSEQLMMPSLRLMREDARATLEVAFHDGIAKPVLVPEYFSYRRRILGGREIEFHHFRVVYARFVIATIEGRRPIIWDIRLADGFDQVGDAIVSAPSISLSMHVN